MAMGTGERLDTLENALKELAYAARRTEMTVDKLSEENREYGARLDRAIAQRLVHDEQEQIRQQHEREEREKERQEREKKREKEREERERERRDERREWNRKWGELANKMGTLVEDIVLPNFPRILHRYFGVTHIDRTLPRPKVRHPLHPDRLREFDLIAYNAKTVFLNETKSDPSAEAFTRFVTDESLFEYFPELAGRKLVRIAAALYMPEDVVTYLSRHGCYAMMLGEETMDIVNFKEVTGKELPPGPAGYM